MIRAVFTLCLGTSGFVGLWISTNWIAAISVIALIWALNLDNDISGRYVRPAKIDKTKSAQGNKL